jgi:choline dehydrogenase-like flavoprotein
MFGAFILVLVSIPSYFASLPYFEPDDERYDFIVVGAGAAGSMIAAQLSKSGYDVLLLGAFGLSYNDCVISFSYVCSCGVFADAGGDAGTGVGRDSGASESAGQSASIQSAFNSLPFMWSTMSSVNDYVWPDLAVTSVGAQPSAPGAAVKPSPKPPAAGNGNEDGHKNEVPVRQVEVLTGKGFGGSELLSSMIYMRALKSDIDKWLGGNATALGNESAVGGPEVALDYPSLQRTYLALEKYLSAPSNAVSVNAAHGAAGPILVSRPSPALNSGLVSAGFISAAQAAFPELPVASHYEQMHNFSQ